MASSLDIRITSLEGNHQLLDGGAMFGNAPRPLWERWAHPDHLGRISLSCRSMLVEIGTTRLLCETGIGAYMDPQLASRYGVVEKEHCLLESLKRRGLEHTDIDYVILSHLHFDHAGGLLPAFGSQDGDTLLFPRARYVVGKEAWQRAQKPHPRDRASFIPGLSEKLEASGRLLIIDSEELPGFDPKVLSFRFSSGHTPGHMHTLIRGSQQTMFFAGDLIPGKAWVHLPITMGYDRYAEQVIDEKASLYEEAVPAGWFLFFTHDPQVAAAQVDRDAKDRFVTKSELPELEAYRLS